MAKNDWYEAGEAIRNLVQNAVENQDFTQLSSTITNVINQTVDGFQDALWESLRGRPQSGREGSGERAGDQSWNDRSGKEKQAQNDREDYAEHSRDYRGDEAGRAQNYWERTAEQFRDDGRNDTYDDQSGSAGGNYHYRMGGVRFSGQEAADRIRRNMEEKRQEIRPVSNLKAPGRAIGWFLAATGYGFGSMFGLALVIVAVIGDAVGGIPDFVYVILGLFTGLNLWMGSVGSERLGLASRFRRYVAMLGNRTFCTIEELASGTGKTIKYIRKDLKKMLRRGFFPEGHLDRKETCLITDNETYQQYLLTQQEADRRAVFGEAAWSAENAGAGNGSVSGSAGSGLNSGQAGGAGGTSGNWSDGTKGGRGSGRSDSSRESAAARPGGETDNSDFGRFGSAGQSSDNRADEGSKGRDFGERDKTQANGNPQAALNQECGKLIEEGRRYIAHIRECNDKIPGEEISAKLDRLELVVTRIFREVERRPELAPELRKMMSYYLPTTQKLIDAYCQFDEQPIRGQNIDSTKREIENALDTINQAFENLLDGFFENTAWDISSDISVLHTMFAQEGLTGKDFPKGGK